MHALWVESKVWLVFSHPHPSDGVTPESRLMNPTQPQLLQLLQLLPRGLSNTI